MNKALTLAALLSLSFASGDIHDNNLNFIKILEKDFEKMGKFISSHLHIWDDELFNVHQLEEGVKKAGQILVQHPELVKGAEQKLEQIIHRYSGHKDLLKQDAKKAIEYITQHPEVIKQAVEFGKNFHFEVPADEELFSISEVVKNMKQDAKDNINRAKQGAQIAQHLILDQVKKTGFDDEELFSLSGTIQDVKDKIHRTKEGVEIAKHLIKDQVKKTGFDDEELFSLSGTIQDVKDNINRAKQGAQIAKHLIKDKKEEIKHALGFDEEFFSLSGTIQDVKDKIHRTKEGVEIAKHLIKDQVKKTGFDDEELFNLGGLIKDGLNIYKDVKTHNYGDLVSHGVQTVKDVKQATHGKKFLGH